MTKNIEAPRQDATWGDNGTDSIAIGQLMANLRKTHGLGKDPDRAAVRAAQLTEIDTDWNCPWPLDWQRHHRVLAGLAADEPDGRLPAIAPESSSTATTSAAESPTSSAPGPSSPTSSAAA